MIHAIHATIIYINIQILSIYNHPIVVHNLSTMDHFDTHPFFKLHKNIGAKLQTPRPVGVGE